ncbi:MAG TPA: hypothetical protein VFZ22_16770 [Pyrinomonadaceae bacterium]|nr:hypothetical protein [Pyrinomonadaceae bacterium]
MSIETTETFAELAIPVNPFPGLRPFDFDESHLFFGRDGQSEQLISKLGRTRFLAVVGTSGSGKSSLVRAGLMPALLGGFMSSAGSNWRIAVARPGNDPVGNLARALNDPAVFGSDVQENAALQTALAEATLQRGSRGLIDTVRQALMTENENVLVIVDQFEELFRFARVAKDAKYVNEAAAFVKLLLEAARQRELPIYVVLTMRSDYLGDCSQFWGLPEAINESQYLIPRLTRDQLREAMTGPISVAHGRITPRLVARLLNDVGDDQDQLPVLQHLLMRIWDEAKEKRLYIETTENGKTVRIPHKNVHHGDALDVCCCDAVEGMARALSVHADEAFNELPNDRSRQVAESIFKALTEKGTDNREIRRPVTLGELSAVVDASESEIVTVIETFRRPGRSFLVPAAGVELQSKSLIDISHESLIRGWARLKGWVDEEARSARIYLRVAETAVLWSEGGAGLWRDPDLQVALAWREKSKPNETWARRYHPQFPLAMSFLDKSVAERDADARREEERRKREIRRTRLTALVFAIGCLASVIAGTIAFAQSRKAIAAKNEADVQKNIALQAKADALGLRDEANYLKGVAEHNLIEISDQKTKTDKALTELKTQKRATDTALAEANRQRTVAQVALQRQTGEALKGQGLSALKEGKETEALDYFNQLHQHAQKTREPSGDIFALTSIADIYRDRVPIFLFLSDLTDGNQFDDSDDSDTAKAMKQYAQMYMLSSTKDKDEETMIQEMRANNQLATEKYLAALAANKNVSDRESGARQGYIYQNLGDLALTSTPEELQISPNDRRSNSDAVFEAHRKEVFERAMEHYAHARDAYRDAQLYSDEAEMLRKMASVKYAERRKNKQATAEQGPEQTLTRSGGPFPAALMEVINLYEQAAASFKLAGKPLRQAVMFLAIAEIYKDLPKEHRMRRNAIRYLQHARDIYRTQKNFARQVSTDEELAKAYADASNTDNQILALKDALAAQRNITATTKSDSARAESERRVSTLVNNIGELLHESAEDKDETAVNQFFADVLNGSSGLDRANLLSAIAQFYKQHGDTDSAVRYLSQKREVYNQLGNGIEEGNTFYEIGTMYNDADKTVDASKAFSDAFDSYRNSRDKLKDYQNSHQVVANLLVIARNLATTDQQKSIAVYEETIRISFASQLLIYNVIPAMQGLGELYLEMKTEEGNAKARQLFQTTIDAYVAVRSESEPDLRATVGDVYKKVGDKVQARAAYDRALAMYSTKEFGSYRHIEVLRKIGTLVTEGTEQTLGTFYLKDADAARQAGDAARQALSLELAGGFYRDTSEGAKAFEYYEQARALYHSAGLKLKEVSLLRTLAMMYEIKGDKQKAKDLRRQADQLEPPPATP